MKLVTYEGDYGYCRIDGQNFPKGQEIEVSDALAEKCKASDEPFSVKGEKKSESQDKGD